MSLLLFCCLKKVFYILTHIQSFFPFSTIMTMKNNFLQTPETPEVIQSDLCNHSCVTYTSLSFLLIFIALT